MSLQGHCLEFLKFSGELWKSPVIGDKVLCPISKRLMRRILETRSWSASPQSLRRLANLSGIHIQPCEGLEGHWQQPVQISEGQTVPDELECFLKGDG